MCKYNQVKKNLVEAGVSRIMCCVSAVLFMPLLFGCTDELMVKKVYENDVPVNRKGFVYHLQYNQYDISITRGIVNCVNDSGLPDVKAFVKADVTSNIYNDANHMYIVESDSLMGQSKVSELSMTWKDGKLLSINAAADDKTAEIISSVVSGAAKLALSSIVPVPTLPASATLNEKELLKKELVTVDVIQCKAGVEKAISNIAKLNKEIENSNNEISKIGEDVTRLKGELKDVKDGVDVDCSNPKNSSDVQCKLRKAINELEALNIKLSVDKKLLQSSLSKVSYTKVYTWPESSKVGSTAKPFQIPDEYISQWIGDKDDMKKIEIMERSIIDDSQKSIDGFSKEFDVHFGLHKVGSYGLKTAGQDSVELKAADGIKYRVPALGRLLVCRKEACKDEHSKLLIAQKKEKIHQLGLIFHIPFKSDAFTNRGFGLVFDEHGVLTQASMKQAESAGENIASLVEDVATQISEYKTAKQKAETPKSDLELLQDQVDLLKAQKELKDLQLSLDPSEATLQLSDIQKNIQLAQARKEYLEAVNALNTSEAAKDVNVEEIDVLKSETTLLLAEAAKLEAQLKIKNARDALNRK